MASIVVHLAITYGDPDGVAPPTPSPRGPGSRSNPTPQIAMTIERNEAEPAADTKTPVELFVNNKRVLSTTLGPAGKATISREMIEEALKQPDATRAAAASRDS